MKWFGRFPKVNKKRKVVSTSGENHKFDETLSINGSSIFVGIDGDIDPLDPLSEIWIGNDETNNEESETK